MYIGKVDTPTTALLEKRMARKQESKRRKLSEKKIEPRASTSTSLPDEIHTSRPAKIIAMDLNASIMHQYSSTSHSDTASEGSTGVLSKASTYNTMSVYRTAEAAERTDVSDATAAMIATAALFDANVITSEDQSFVIDRSKIRRARLVLRSTNSENLEQETLHAFFYDGRKDQTLKIQFGRQKRVVEEHISMLREPGSIYLSHVTVGDGGAESLTDTMKNRLLDKNIDLSTIRAIGCDGTNTNVGDKSGVIRRFELSLDRNLQWLVCLLHANELPLRKLLYAVFGKTNDPRNFSGPVGSLLGKCESMDIIAFDTIHSAEFHNINTSTLTSNMKYLVDICRVISTGSVPENFQYRSPGK